MEISRRQFLKTAGGTGLFFGVSAEAGLELHSPKPIGPGKRDFRANRPDVAVVGAGAFGMWTALYLRRLGANVTVIDMYGPANSRSSSGDETRGIKSSYGNRPHGLQWAAWAREATERWKRWDAEWRDRQHPRLFFQTGDLILRRGMPAALQQSIVNWNTLGVPYETVSQAEMRKRFSGINAEEFDTAVFEPNAGVVRSRRALEAVAEVFTAEGGAILIDKAELAPGAEPGTSSLKLSSGTTISAGTYVFACGPWLPKVLPDVMKNRMRTPMGHVYYLGTPPGDDRFTYPNFPSCDVPGATGWPALTTDNRGFRLRTGGRLLQDPDLSDRSIPRRHVEAARRILAGLFPDLADAPILETRSAHYNYTIDSNLIVDTHPALDDAWIVGGGASESFKFGPVLGEYIARRALELETDPQLEDGFRLVDTEYGDFPEKKEPGWLDRKLDEYCRDRL